MRADLVSHFAEKPLLGVESEEGILHVIDQHLWEVVVPGNHIVGDELSRVVLRKILKDSNDQLSHSVREPFQRVLRIALGL